MKKYSSSISQRLTGRHKYSFKFCGSVKGKKILDVGSSYGWFEKFAVGAGCQSILGIEPDGNFYNAKKEVPQAVFKQGSALKIPAKDKSFNIVVMFDVIEHIPKGTEIQALNEIKRVLKPKGKFIMSTDFDWWLAKFMDPAWYFGHRHYSQEKLEKLFNLAGFQVVEFQKRGGYFEMTGTILLYLFKWIFRREIPFKSFFDRKKDAEFLNKNDGFVTIFAKTIVR